MCRREGYRSYKGKIATRSDLSETEPHHLLQKLGQRIDKVFGSQKEYERLLKIQADALEKIEYHAALIKNAFSEDSPYYTLINKILHETKKRT